MTADAASRRSTRGDGGAPAPGRRLELLAVGLLGSWSSASGGSPSCSTVPAVQTARTVFVSIVVQALPFLVLGVVLSAAITAFVPASFWARALPGNRGLAVPVAGAAGVVLPGCECASVPVAGGLMSRGVAPAAALAFLLSAPAINPIVLVSTFVAFPASPRWCWPGCGLARHRRGRWAGCGARFGRGDWMRIPRRPTWSGSAPLQTSSGSPPRTTSCTRGASWSSAGSPRRCSTCSSRRRGSRPWPTTRCSRCWPRRRSRSCSSICSEADAFVAASLTQFSLTARLAFLVVGPMVDLKLMPLQAGTFGRRFAVAVRPDHLRGRGARPRPRGVVAAADPRGQASCWCCVGGAVLRISVGDAYLNYVKESLRPLAARRRRRASWCCSGSWSALRDGLLRRGHRRPAGPSDDDGRRPRPRPRRPAGGLAAAAPRAGDLPGRAAGAGRLRRGPRHGIGAARPADADVPAAAAGRPRRAAAWSTTSRAPSGTTAAPSRAAPWRSPGSSPPDPAGGWWLTRLCLACCAADALAAKVVAVDAPAAAGGHLGDRHAAVGARRGHRQPGRGSTPAGARGLERGGPASEPVRVTGPRRGHQPGRRRSGRRSRGCG